MEREKSLINKVAILCHTVIVIVLMLAYALEVFKGSRTIGYYAVFSILAAVPVIIEWILYKNNPSQKIIQHILGFGYSAFYIFVIFTTTDLTAFTYAIPMYLIIMLYSDVRYCIAISSGGFIVNLIYTIIQAVNVGIPSEMMTT